MGSCVSVKQYDYSNLPSGYRWRAVQDRNTKGIVFYGQDPLTHDTVYVGPDGRFFIFHHPGPIEPKDLTQSWNPR